MLQRKTADAYFQLVQRNLIQKAVKRLSTALGVSHSLII